VTTYAELEHRSTRLALGLRERGIALGARVVFLGLNSVELVETMFAVAKLGAVFLPVNTRLVAPELRHVLADSGARLLIWEAGFEPGVESPEVAGLGLEQVRISDGPGAGLSTLFAVADGVLDEPVALEDLFMIQYTSGTSGRPKGVMLSHANVVTAPLFHTAALNQVLVSTVLNGGTALIEVRFDPDRAIELIESEGVTLLFGVTSMYLVLAARALRGGRPEHAAQCVEWGSSDPRVTAAHLVGPWADDHPGLRSRSPRRERRCCAPPTACASSDLPGPRASSPTCAWFLRRWSRSLPEIPARSSSRAQRDLGLLAERGRHGGGVRRRLAAHG
jgi:acyl-CoA synthetase (AMP-forming)/AMP-acid ligase II